MEWAWNPAWTASPGCRCTASTAPPGSRRQRCWEGLDALIFDIQDVGARFYTFLWTMATA